MNFISFLGFLFLLPNQYYYQVEKWHQKIAEYFPSKIVKQKFLLLTTRLQALQHELLQKFVKTNFFNIN